MVCIIFTNKFYGILTAFENLVLITPGAKQFTRMPSGAKSLAAAFVRPIKAVLLTE